MADGHRCRATLSDGTRCRYKAKSKGVCGIHKRALKEERSNFQLLLEAGKYAAAVTALIKFIETTLPLVKQSEPYVSAFGHSVVNWCVSIFGGMMYQLPGSGLDINKCLTKAKRLSDFPDETALSDLAVRVFDYVDESLQLDEGER